MPGGGSIGGLRPAALAKHRHPPGGLGEGGLQCVEDGSIDGNKLVERGQLVRIQRFDRKAFGLVFRPGQRERLVIPGSKRL